MHVEQESRGQVGVGCGRTDAETVRVASRAVMSPISVRGTPTDSTTCSHDDVPSYGATNDSTRRPGATNSHNDGSR